MKYLARISYNGTDFCGFQIQSSVRTVQGELTSAFSALLGAPCSMVGCSRTDAGVHARESYVCITVPEGAHNIPCDKIPLAISRLLPGDLSVKSIEAVHEDFNIHRSVSRKTYVYLLSNSAVNDPFLLNRAWQYMYPLPSNGLEKMQMACEHFLGSHDFSSFMSAGSSVTTTIRRIDRLTVERSGYIYTFTITANGFLYNMVRIIVGTLIDVAIGRISPDDISSIINSRERKLAGETAPPEGLYLEHVEFN